MMSTHWSEMTVDAERDAHDVGHAKKPRAPILLSRTHTSITLSAPPLYLTKNARMWAIFGKETGARGGCNSSYMTLCDLSCCWHDPLQCDAFDPSRRRHRLRADEQRARGDGRAPRPGQSGPGHHHGAQAEPVLRLRGRRILGQRQADRCVPFPGPSCACDFIPAARRATAV